MGRFGFKSALVCLPYYPAAACGSISSPSHTICIVQTSGMYACLSVQTHARTRTSTCVMTVYQYNNKIFTCYVTVNKKRNTNLSTIINSNNKYNK